MNLAEGSSKLPFSKNKKTSFLQRQNTPTIKWSGHTMRHRATHTDRQTCGAVSRSDDRAQWIENKWHDWSLG